MGISLFSFKTIRSIHDKELGLSMKNLELFVDTVVTKWRSEKNTILLWRP